MWVNAIEDDSGPGRLVIRADEPSLTPYAGLAIVGELARRVGLRELLDGELAKVGRAGPIKRRRRGVSPGQLVAALAESQLVGGDCFDDLQKLRADRAGAVLRIVPATPSAPTARQLARRYRRSHVQAVERALARAGQRLDRSLERDPGAPVTVDVDATESEVYGRAKQGAAKSRSGALAYQTYAAFWAQRGRPLCWELEAGNKSKCNARESIRLCRRALALLGAGHGPVDFRLDSGFYAVELMRWLRVQDARFTISAPRTSTMWKALDRIPEIAWAPATGMPASEVAEATISPDGWPHEPLRLIVRRTTFTAAQLSGDPRARRQRTIPADQLQLLIDGQRDSVYGYSFIVTDRAGSAAEVEHHHRHRAQIEERNKDAKLGQALRHLPSGDHNANRVWQAATMTALTLAAMTCDLCPAAAASQPTPEPDTQPAPAPEPEPEPEPKPEPDTQPEPEPGRRPPQRRHAKALRDMLFCIPARVIRHSRRTILRLPDGHPHAATFSGTYHAAWALAP